MKKDIIPMASMAPMAPVPPMTYQQALDFLYQHVRSQRTVARTPAAAQQKLTRMRALLHALGDPDHRVCSIVVAGTKGKGSTCAILERILRAAGYRTGLWISPHLHSYRERIQVNREMITQEQVVAHVEHLRTLVADFDVAQHGKPTPFELGFAMALCFFAEQQVDVAVLEVGIGGRYDAVNVVTPILSLISSISYDHIEILGPTLADIAYDKAGILKQGISSLSMAHSGLVGDVLKQVADEVGAPYWVAHEEKIVREGGGRSSKKEYQRYPVAPIPALRGVFQRHNARLAVGAALLLRNQGWNLPTSAIADGLKAVQWVGRLEVIEQTPYTPTIVVDGAHNGESIGLLLQSLDETCSYRRLITVFGVTQGKDVEAMIKLIAPRSAVMILTRSDHPAANHAFDQLTDMIQPHLHGMLLVAPYMQDALLYAKEHASPDDLICVTGSLFVVSAAREALGVAGVCD